MKLICGQSDLSSNLSLVSRAVPSRPTHPVLANVLLMADSQTQQVSLTAFDLSLGIRTSFSAQVDTGGGITLPAKLLNDIVSRLPEGELTLDDGEDETNVSLLVTLTAASGQYQVRGMEAEEFPELPVIEQGEAIYLSRDVVVEGLRGSLFATSADEAKQVLTGVHLKFQPVPTAEQNDYSLEFAATDGHRLAVVQFQSLEEMLPDSFKRQRQELDKVDSASLLEVTIPAKALRELERMLGTRQSEVLALHFDQGQVIFEWANQRLTSRTLDGQYPAYRQLIPRQFERQVTVERRQLLSALERVAVLADQKNNVIKFSIDSVNQQIALSVEAQDIGSAREFLPADISGESIDIAFNVRYLLEGIKALSTSEIQLQLNSATSPVVLIPLGSTKITYLLMPVQLRG